MNLLTSRTGAYPLAKAYEYAKQLQQSDNEWQYVVVDCGNGLGRIDIYDEDGLLIEQGAIF